MSGRPVTTIVIVDDDALVRGGLRTILSLEDDLDVIGEAADGAEAVDVVAGLDPDVVLMDVRMPGTDGLTATARIVDAGSRSRVLVVTTFENDDYVYDALRAGASGFVLKRVKPEELIQAIRIVADGESLVFPELTRRLVEINTPAAGDDERRRLIDELTDREREILTLLVRGRSNAEIAQELVVALHTVKTHVAHILSKLGARDRTQAVIIAYESGFIRPGEGDG